MMPRAVVIHGAVHLVQATAPGLPVLLLSAPGAGCFAGAGWWRALTGERPAALDCADQAGRALEALAVGCPVVILEDCPAWDSVAARRGPAVLLRARPASLDLGVRGAGRHLVRWLQGDSAGGFG